MFRWHLIQLDGNQISSSQLTMCENIKARMGATFDTCTESTANVHSTTNTARQHARVSFNDETGYITGPRE